MKLAADAPNIPLLRYPGSKHQLTRWIIPFIPASHDAYNEPFAGSAAVLLQKERSRMETLNDKSREVVNFLRTLATRRDELVEAIRYTPWSPDEHQLSLQPASDPLEAARRFYFRCWASIRPFDRSPGYRRQKLISRGRQGDKAPMTTAVRQFARTDHLYWVANRLRGVAFEHMDGVEFIKMYDYDRAFFYVDPPYLLKTRSNQVGDAYLEEMGSEAEHVRLAETLRSIAGMAIVSGYATDKDGRPNHLYRDLYEKQDYLRVDRPARVDGGGSRVESLWLCPRTQAALQHEESRKARRQLPLLAGAKGGL